MTAVHRGTSNGNVSGSSYDRRRRKAWLIEHYRADIDYFVPKPGVEARVARGECIDLRLDVVEVPACRCYRCGILLTFETVTVDRIIPGCLGGTYRRNNIRPACGPCNSETGGALRGKAKR